MTLGLIWAQSRSGVIGREGAIPWHVPEDLAHFRAVTGTSAVVMGRRTWQSLPERFRPLPGRRNVVVTRQTGWNADGALVAHTVAEALAAAQRHDSGDTWVIGGGELYAATIDDADLLEVTEIDDDLSGDTYAPTIDDAWSIRTGDPGTGPSAEWSTSRTGTRYRFLTYDRAMQ